MQPLRNSCLREPHFLPKEPGAMAPSEFRMVHRGPHGGRPFDDLGQVADLSSWFGIPGNLMPALEDAK